MKKALVLGGSGFIGSHLVELLQKKTYNVAICDLVTPTSFPYNGQFFKGDVRDYQSIRETALLFEPDVIFDCSGVLGTAETFDHISLAIETNILGTINTLEVAKELKVPSIYVSLTNRWLNPYTITKRAAEKFCLMYAQEFGMKVAVLKGLNAYGPRQHWLKVRKIGPTFIINAIENKPIIINGNGLQIVDMVHATDLAEMLLRIYERGTCWGMSIDGGTGVPMTVNEVAEKVIKMTNSKSKIIYQPMRRGEPIMAITLANPSAVRQLLDFYPRIQFEDGMRETIKWYRENYKTWT